MKLLKAVLYTYGASMLVYIVLSCADEMLISRSQFDWGIREFAYMMTVRVIWSGAIQLALSSVNAMLAWYLISKGRLTHTAVDLLKFYIPYIVLWAIPFSLIAVSASNEHEEVRYILFLWFMIYLPYIIGSAVSIPLFHYFLKRQFKTSSYETI